MSDRIDALKAWQFLLDWHGLEAELIEIKVTDDDVLPDGAMIIECAHRHTCQHW